MPKIKLLYSSKSLLFSCINGNARREAKIHKMKRLSVLLHYVKVIKFTTILNMKRQIHTDQIKTRKANADNFEEIFSIFTYCLIVLRLINRCIERSSVN